MSLAGAIPVAVSLGLGAVLTTVALLPGAPRAVAPAHPPVAAPSTSGAAAQVANPRYDGRFTFARVRYGSGERGFRGFGGAAWAHDYPAADRNMQFMLDEFTAVRAHRDASTVLELEDPEIFRHPILYVSEPGFWFLSDEGAANLRAHLLKGGLIVFDDFEARQWDNMAEQMAKALPEGAWIELDPSHPVFGTFFRVDDIYVPHPSVRVTPAYLAIFENNDPTRRIVALANHNSDLAEYWEYFAQGYFPVDPTNDAFRLGINYFIYGMTY